jgi:hypothetical protein
MHFQQSFTGPQKAIPAEGPVDNVHKWYSSNITKLDSIKVFRNFELRKRKGKTDTWLLAYIALNPEKRVEKADNSCLLVMLIRSLI